MAMSVLRHTDSNWDLQNYHLYNAFSVLNGRLGLDYFVAGFQGYFNPLADIPYYITKFILFPTHPAVVAAAAGLPFGCLIFIVFMIAQIALPESGHFEPAVSTVLGVTAASTFSEIGTSFNDVLIADLVLSGALLLLVQWKNVRCAAILAGLAVGCAGGLKFTAMAFAPGVLLLGIITVADLRKVLVLCACFCIAFVIGFLASWGWWGYLLWRQFHNPFFPLFGSVFPSPWAPVIQGHDVGFLPHSLLQWLFYPFYWLQGNRFVVSEEPMRDPRFALVYSALAIRIFGIKWHLAPPLPRNVIAIFAFFLVGFFFWLVGFSILRYAVPIEAMTGIIIWASIKPFFRRNSLLVLCGICAVCLATTEHMQWGRIRYSKSLVEFPVPEIAPHSLVFVSGAPIGFVVPYVNGPDDRFISLDWLAIDSEESPEVLFVRRLILSGTPIRLLTNRIESSQTSVDLEGELARFGLIYSESRCAPIRTAVQKAIRICEVLPTK
jgi:hypothetical protein